MKRCKPLLSVFLFSSLCLISCGRNTAEEVKTNQPEAKESVQSSLGIEGTELSAPAAENSVKPKLEPTEEDVYPDLDRVFLYKDWHPLRQTEYIKGVKERLKNQEKKDVDDSLYDDEFTTEFSLHDEKRNFCIYHSVRNVNEYDIDDYEIFNYVKSRGEEFVWCFQEKEDISIEWVEDTGVIVTLGTDKPRYATKRGIRVGDSAEKVMGAYKDDCIVKEYNYTEKKWEVVSEKEYPCMLLSKSNEWISLNIGNDRAEGMMTISYLLENDVVTKIIIQGS
ncbi:MAG: hypothetical protein J6Y16_11045 [Treponema sp.]|nr:hypothetical protein [Treponema sp.]MBP5452762.1 hypothetical protein [Treponema sp.]